MRLDLTREELIKICEGDFKKIKVTKKDESILDEAFTAEYNNVVPADGKTGVLHGELLRGFGALDYFYYNNDYKLDLNLSHCRVHSLGHRLAKLGDIIEETTGIKLGKMIRDIFGNKGVYEIKLLKVKYLIINCAKLSDLHLEFNTDIYEL